MRMTRTPQRPASWAVLAVLLTLGLLLAACGSAALPQPGTGGSEVDVDHGAPPPAEEPARGDGDAVGEPGRFDGLASLLERRIIKTGEMRIEVPDVAAALGRLRVVADEMGGHVAGSQAGTLDERASITLRVPSQRFDELIARLHELDGTVLAETTREDDVTGAIVDLEARIENLRASEAQYRGLLERAEKIDDILAVQGRLDQVRGQIEQLDAQLKQLSGQADLATLTVALIPAAESVKVVAAEWNPGATLDEALGALLAVGQAVVTALIWFAVVWLPILMLLAIAALVLLRGIIEVRRRTPRTSER